MAVQAPPIKKRFVPFQLDTLTGRYDPETINRNFRKLTDSFGVLAQKLQVNYVSLPQTDRAEVPAQSFNAYEQESDSSGNEVVLYEFLVDFTVTTKATLKLNMSMRAASAGGAATIRAWVGGTFISAFRVPPSGNVIGAAATAVSAFRTVKIVGSFANPGAEVPLQIAVKSAGAGQKTTVQRVAWTWAA